MLKKPTSELSKALSGSNSLNDFINTNKDFFIDKSVSEYLNELLIEKQLSKVDVLKKAELNENYGFQIFSGTRKTPSRDKLICLCVGMALTIEETDGLLKLAGYASLYPKNKHDSIVLFGIQNGQDICTINEALYEHGEKTLG